MKAKVKKTTRKLCLICRRVLTKSNVNANLNPWICKSCMGYEEEARENLENTIAAFDWIIRHLKSHDFSKENLPDAVVDAVDLLTDELRVQRDGFAARLLEKGKHYRSEACGTA